LEVTSRRAFIRAFGATARVSFKRDAREQV
jgi:hypothetical protein